MQNQNGRQLKMQPIRLSQIKRKKSGCSNQTSKCLFLTALRVAHDENVKSRRTELRRSTFICSPGQRKWRPLHPSASLMKIPTDEAISAPVKIASLQHTYFTSSKKHESHKSDQRLLLNYGHLILKRGRVRKMNLERDRALIHFANLPVKSQPALSLSTPLCGSLMRNRVWLQSLIKASSGNRPLAGCSFLSLTSCYFVFPLHHYTSVQLLSSLLTCQPLRFLFSPSSATLFLHVVICHPLGKHGCRTHVLESEPPGGLRHQTFR